jgi:hypothetical protein
MPAIDLLLNTAHRLSEALDVVTAVAGTLQHVVVDVTHVPEVGVAIISLRGRPPVAVVAGTAETASGAVAVAAR